MRHPAYSVTPAEERRAARVQCHATRKVRPATPLQCHADEARCTPPDAVHTGRHPPRVRRATRSCSWRLGILRARVAKRNGRLADTVVHHILCERQHAVTRRNAAN